MCVPGAIQKTVKTRRQDFSRKALLLHFCALQNNIRKRLTNFTEQKERCNQAMHRMPNPPLRYGLVTGDGGRYAY